MTKMVVTEKEIWREILLVYKDMPCLWKPNDDDYYNRDVKQKAVDSLFKIYRKYDPNATCLNFKKRLENMRTSYNRERKKVRHSFFTEPDPEKRHKPTLWYYDIMKFLDEEDRPETKKWEPIEIVDVEIQHEEPEVVTKKRKPTEKNQIVEETPPVVNENPVVKDNRIWEIQGRAIGYSLSELREDQKIVAEKLISDVIFYGKLGKLTDTAFVSISSQTDDDVFFSEKYVNMGTVDYGGTSPTPSNHSSNNSSNLVGSEAKNKSKGYKPKILIVKRMKEE